jgi:hypothetical protein
MACVDRRLVKFREISDRNTVVMLCHPQHPVLAALQ